MILVHMAPNSRVYILSSWEGGSSGEKSIYLEQAAFSDPVATTIFTSKHDAPES